MTDGIAAVQARMAQIRSLVNPVVSIPVQATTSQDFATTLDALTRSASGAGPAAHDSATAQSLLAAAEKYVGTPYVWGGESLSEGGLDCSGLVLRSLADIGVTDVPRVARDQMSMGTAVPSLDQALPGDLLVFGGGTHIAIYEGDGTMIDAPKPGGKVGIRDVWGTPTAIRRILPQESDMQVGALVSGAAASASAQRAALDLLSSLGSTGGSSAGLASSLGLASGLGVAS